jgi:hypothetical protein
VPVELVVEHVLTALIVGGTFVAIAFSPLARAIGNRIMHGRLPAPGARTDDPRTDDLIDELTATRRQVEELADRLDFAERLLAQARERGLLGANER